MDSSNRLAQALGFYRVNLYEMTPGERVQLLKRALHYCKPLKYFSFFTPLHALLNWQNGTGTHETRNDHFEGPESLQVGTKLLPVWKLWEHREEHPLSAPGERVQTQQLMLSIDEELFLWEEVFYRDFEQEEGAQRRVFESVKSSQFTLLDDGALEKLLTPETLQFCLLELCNKAAHDVERCRRRQEHVDEVWSKLHGITQRIRAGSV